MECKYYLCEIFQVGLVELIDTLWNVNPRGYYTFLDGITELIDTLWNVNQMLQTIALAASMELIDTLWNVNHQKASTVQFRAPARINRYIMECKYYFSQCG